MSMAQFAMIQELKARVVELERRVKELEKPPNEPKRQETLTLKRNAN